MFELQSGVVVLRRRSPRRAGIVAAFLALLTAAPVAAAGQLRQVVDGLVAENGLAESVQPVPFHIVKGVFVHLLTPDLRESEKPGPIASPPVSMLLRQLRPAPKYRRKRQNSPGRS